MKRVDVGNKGLTKVEKGERGGNGWKGVDKGGQGLNRG